LAGVETVADNASAAAEPPCGLGVAEFTVAVGCGGGNIVGVADPVTGGIIGLASVTGGQSGVVEPFSRLEGGGGRTEPADHLDRG
jgi:hypothetical protein